jgi:hypothetical protein
MLIEREDVEELLHQFRAGGADERLPNLLLVDAPTLTQHYEVRL